MAHNIFLGVCNIPILARLGYYVVQIMRFCQIDYITYVFIVKTWLITFHKHFCTHFR
jgi:hypothetical protein